MADEKPDKMALWNRHATSNPKDLKEVTYGRTFHSIDAHSQLKNGTDEWGPLGSGWGWKGEIKTQFTHAPDGTEDGVLAQAVFFYRDADGKMYEFPVLDDIEIWHEKDGKRVYNNEYAKKLQTSMRSKALSKLGFNSDVFEGQHDSRYVDSKPAAKKDTPAKKDAALKVTPEAVADTFDGEVVGDPNRPANPPDNSGKKVSAAQLESYIPAAIGRSNKANWTSDMRHAVLTRMGIEDYADLSMDQVSWLFGLKAKADGTTYGNKKPYKGLFEEAPPAELTGPGRPTEREEPIDVGYGQDDDIPF